MISTTTHSRDLSWQPSRHKDFMMLLIQISILMMVINMTSNSSENSFVYSVLVASFQTDKERELVKEFEGDARSILSKLHHYHTESNVAQHEVETLTTYITNLRLTDSWKGTTCQFLRHFKGNVCLLFALSLTLTRPRNSQDPLPSQGCPKEP